MMTFLLIVLATFIDSLVGLIGVFALFVKEKFIHRLLKTLVAFSAGALLGGAFFHLLVESLEKTDPMITFGICTIGFLVFFVLEGYLHWHHCEGECKEHPYSYLMAIGDSIHNVLDGLVIAGAFLVSIELGLVATLVIIAHEVPQELGAFAVLVSGGFSRKKAILFSFLAQCTCMIGGIFGYFFMTKLSLLALYIIPFAAGGFIYIAAADLIPSMHESKDLGKISAFLWLCIGLLFMLAIKVLLNA